MANLSAEKLKAVRKKAKLTQQQLAKLIDYSERSIRDVEGNKLGAIEKMRDKTKRLWFDTCVALMNEDEQEQAVRDYFRMQDLTKYLKFFSKKT